MKKRYLGLILIILQGMAFAGTVIHPEKNMQQPYVQPAAYFINMVQQKVKCVLCPRYCVLKPGSSGDCLIRKNIKGDLFTINYGNVSLYQSSSGDYSNFPLTAIWLPRLDVRGVSGCSLKCSFCYVGEIIQRNPETMRRTGGYSPEQIIKEAEKRGVRIITFTDNEPGINFEYTLAVAQLAKKHGLKVIVTTAGYVNPEPFAKMVELADVVYFSFKGFSKRSYEKYTTGEIDTVLQNVKQLKTKKIKTEILYVVIPTISDSAEDIRHMSRWVRENLGADTPVHFMRYMPAYKLKNLPSPSLVSIKNAVALAHDEGLLFALPYANFGRYDLKELIAADLMTMRCPHCGSIVAQCRMPTDNVPVLFQDFGKDHTCGSCGKAFLPIFMK